MGEAVALARGNTVGVRDQIMDLVAGQGLSVTRTEVNALLPTPTARDFKDGSTAYSRDGVLQTDTIARAVINSGEITGFSWGRFEDAIRAWESITGNPAPLPSKPDGRNGAHRLSSEFTEWMMGLDSGWITSAGLSRTAELKAAGNGVVPQQAEFALNLLLDYNLRISLGLEE